MGINDANRGVSLMLAVLLATGAFTGCIGDDEDSDARFGSYEEARDAVLRTYEPVNTTSPIRLGLIQPEDPKSIGSGGVDVVVLLFDSEANEPVTDAKFELNAFMPMMGHGTSPETNPTHEAHGVYVGSTTLGMGGTWKLNLNPTLADGTQLEFDVTAQVKGDGGGMGHGGNHSMNGTGPTTQYSSYEDAKNADGRVYEPVGSGPERFKLFEPSDPANVAVGNHTATGLFFDNKTDSALENATMEVTLSRENETSGQATNTRDGLRHADHGVYKGPISMPTEGEWLLEITATRSDGTEVAFEIELDAGDVSDTWGSEGPLFEPYSETFEDNFQESALDPTTTQYDRNFTFDVKAQNARLASNITLANGTDGVTELNVTLFDARNESLGNVVLVGQSDNGSIDVEAAPVGGEYTFRATGQGINGDFTIEVDVFPPGR